ncbi:hypothetical protein C471_15312 [Halorubrum saccharovorum DSM 1137]|uniref:Uncharacterized protein n=1 Tax=Halorubrum saccharovorum DSM 1137 TaxID=1227484 RepID=M0DMY8_9EURY|nr:hypothetical protein [Halorubrum saccharovorum]ELZ36188.1 hypothetical protein C471_15312 [Halorubrum saccharovorum DSM 1137]
MTAGDDAPDSGRLAALIRVALGEAGFERAAVWSAVGFAVSYVAFDVASIAASTAASLGATAVPQGLVAPVAGAVAVLTAVGVAAFAAVGGGVLPAILLAYGPFAAALLRTTGPEPYAIPLSDPVPFVVAVAEPLGAAVAGAVAVGVAGYAVGRVVAGIGGSEEEPDSVFADDSADADD